MDFISCADKDSFRKSSHVYKIDIIHISTNVYNVEKMVTLFK